MVNNQGVVLLLESIFQVGKSLPHLKNEAQRDAVCALDSRAGAAEISRAAGGLCSVCNVCKFVLEASLDLGLPVYYCVNTFPST